MKVMKTWLMKNVTIMSNVFIKLRLFGGETKCARIVTVFWCLNNMQLEQNMRILQSKIRLLKILQRYPSITRTANVPSIFLSSACVFCRHFQHVFFTMQLMTLMHTTRCFPCRAGDKSTLFL